MAGRSIATRVQTFSQLTGLGHIQLGQVSQHFVPGTAQVEMMVTALLVIATDSLQAGSGIQHGTTDEHIASPACVHITSDMMIISQNVCLMADITLDCHSVLPRPAAVLIWA